METFDLVIIGAGPAGEAAAYKGRALEARVAVADREWFGGSCPHIGCIPSKSLLNGAARRAHGEAYDWSLASARRDYMVNRAADVPEPDDSSHVKALESAGAVAYRGEATLVGPGRVRISHDGVDHEIEARNVVVAVGSTSKVPTVPGLADLGDDLWTNREATLARTLPASLLVLGGGPTGCELAQVYARFGVPVTIVQSGPRLLPQDHPRNAEAVTHALREDGVDIRTGARAVTARRGGTGGAHLVELDDGTTALGHRVLLAVGRDFPLQHLGLEHYGFDAADPKAIPHDGRLRLADGLYLVGDPAGPELHTHQAHYQGELAVRMALGEDVVPDYRALPRATYTEPEAASVGLTVDQARERGLDAFELSADFPKTGKGYSVEAETGHVSLVFDTPARELIGAAMACPDASAAIHECVLAIKARVKVEVLADTIHAFPSTSRILNGLYADAAKRLRPRG